MSKGKIIFYDDDRQFTSQFEKLMEESGFEIALFNSLGDLRKALADSQYMANVKAIVFDLAKDAAETAAAENFEVVADIREKFHSIRVPIFIHSAFATSLQEFNGLGTVWKKDKSGSSLQEITEIIGNLDSSGFLEAFTPGGIIEKSLMGDLHQSFTEQFRDGEIEKIIDSLKKEDGDKFKARSITVFKRIAIRSLLSSLMIDRAIEDDTYNEDKISAVEHYIRRINLKNVPIWTGDIFEAKDGSHKIVILTPRCDVASKGKEELLVCVVSNAEELTKKKALEFIRDNIKEKKFRYIPFTPVFGGGKVDFSVQRIVHKKVLAEKFNYLITLSDDLTNEVLGKYCSYLLRTSIPEVDPKELEAFFK